MGGIGEMALQSVTLTLKLSVKMPYMYFQTNGESFTLVTFKTYVFMTWFC